VFFAVKVPLLKESTKKYIREVKIFFYPADMGKFKFRALDEES
jgi:hypothetical protein